jgi:hypothetical protein
MDKMIFSLCALTAAGCATLLLSGYFRTRFRLLLWSGLCFIGFTVNNVVLVLDRVVFTGADLSLLRLGSAFVAVLLLLCGLILESGA